MNYILPIIPFKIPNLKVMQKQFQKLMKLKKGLHISKWESVNEELIFETVSKTNVNDFPLLQSLIHELKYAPEKIQLQYKKIIDCYSSPTEYKNILEETEKLFEEDQEFQDFIIKFKKDLLLGDKNTCRITNSFIYELCSDYINDYVTLEPKKIYLNYHLLYNWMSINDKKAVPRLTELENNILNLLSGSSWPIESINGEVLECNDDYEYIQSLFYQIIPAKLNFKTITQVMAFTFFKIPNLENYVEIANSFNRLNSIFERNKKFKQDE